MGVGVEVAFVVVEVHVAFMVAGAAMTAWEASARMARREDVNFMMTGCGGWKVGDFGWWSWEDVLGYWWEWLS